MKRRVLGAALWGMLFTVALAPAAIASPTTVDAPGVEITSPTHLRSFEARYDAAAGLFGATVQLSADVAGYGQSANVAWFSSDEGFLGIGRAITATLHIQSYDSAQPRIVALIFGDYGVIRADQVQVIIVKRSPDCFRHTEPHRHGRGQEQDRHNHPHWHCPVGLDHHDAGPPLLLNGIAAD
ncbi:MAG: hypothetical protein O6951_05515 [Actinobacteria bacterium]|nr:hypothetical protein [Actinomycetota bacterium]